MTMLNALLKINPENTFKNVLHFKVDFKNNTLMRSLKQTKERRFFVGEEERNENFEDIYLEKHQKVTVGCKKVD